MATNSVRRYNILLDSWVIVAANRVNRPWQGAQTEKSTSGFQKTDEVNPLAPLGNRQAGKITPSYLSTYVFENDYPSFTDHDVPPENRTEDSLFRQETIHGVCRVICYHPSTEKTLATMSNEEVLGVVDVWVDQFNELKERFTWIQIFENRGAAVGCSNAHPHGQLWAGDFLPSIPAKKDTTQRKYYTDHGRPMLCDYIAKEIIKEERVVLLNEDWIVVVPFWAFWPFETLLSPRRHVKTLAELSRGERLSLAKILRELIIKYDNIFQCVFPYSMGWSAAPTGKLLGANDEHWQLHASFYPPLLRSATIPKYMAGYEVFAEPQRDITPEKAAEIIRSQPIERFSKND